jgi:L-seryl-tRNA(Ser) seleniumtransferase
LRIDKLTLAGLEATLRLYRCEELAVKKIPILRMILKSEADLKREAQRLKRIISRQGLKSISCRLFRTSGKTGGGALPKLELPSYAVALSCEKSPQWIQERLRARSIPIIGRIEEDAFLLDVRCLFPEDYPEIAKAVRELENELSSS